VGVGLDVLAASVSSTLHSYDEDIVVHVCTSSSGGGQLRDRPAQRGPLGPRSGGPRRELNGPAEERSGSETVEELRLAADEEVNCELGRLEPIALTPLVVVAALVGKSR
jgi:hypothetical protein